MFTIQQNGDRWEVAGGNGVLSSHPNYEQALAALSSEVARLAAAGELATAGDGTLPERWHSTTGIAFQEQPDPERDFTQCEWSFRDPAVYPLPLMLQTRTEAGHVGAVLAGFMDVVQAGPTPTASGGFYDNEAGRQFRDLLLGGKRFGVSVDPGEMEVEFQCTSEDGDGWCDDGRFVFLAYQIIGLTGTPFPAFANATIELIGAAAEADDSDENDDADDEAEDEAEEALVASGWQRPTVALVASGGFPVRPPAAWMTMAEPELGSELLVEQPDGSMAVPLNITDEGQVFGHLARWGQCHVANPHGADLCVTPPTSSDGYPGFNLGMIVDEDGGEHTTGALFVGCDHPSLVLSAVEARDAYSNTGTAWADVHATAGTFGVWVCGALRPDVSELQLRVLRASTLSGDWRELLDRPGELELIAGLAVNVPGFPIARRAVAAAGGFAPSLVRQRQRVVNGDAVAMVASGLVRPCPECAKRSVAAVTAGAAQPDSNSEVLEALGEVLAKLSVLDRRTRHLAAPAADELARRIRR